MNRFFLFLSVAYLSMNGWILWWFWRTLRGDGRARGIVCFGLLALMSFFPMLYRHSGTSFSFWETMALRAGCFWIGSYIYVFFMTLILDVGRLFGRPLKKRLENLETSQPGYKRAFGVLLLTFCIGLGGWLNASFPVLRETRLEIEVPESLAATLPRSVSVAAIADIHLGRVNGVSRLVRAVDLLLPHKPDAVFYVGDVLDDHIAVDEPGLKREVERLSPPLGTWGVLGNHEYISGPVDVSIAIMERSGIRVLRDEWVALGETVVVAGRDDFSKARFEPAPRKSLEEILRNSADDQRRLPLIVLDHQPQRLEEAERAEAVLQLSGHTHNGQLWPFNLVVARIYENARGTYKRDDTHYIVSVGTGTWGPPLRNNARPEVILVHLDFVGSK